MEDYDTEELQMTLIITPKEEDSCYVGCRIKVLLTCEVGYPHIAPTLIFCNCLLHINVFSQLDGSGIRHQKLLTPINAN